MLERADRARDVGEQRGVDRAVADSLSEKLASRAAALPVGDPRDQGTAIGPLINEAAIRYINRLSDHLFVASRFVNDKGAKDVLWIPGNNR